MKSCVPYGKYILAVFVMMAPRDFVVEAWQSISPELIQKSFRASGQSRDGKVEDIHCLKKGEKAEEAFARVSEFWDKDLEYFQQKTTAAAMTNKHSGFFLV